MSEENGHTIDVVIATPCTDSVKAGFALDLAMLYGRTLAHGLSAAVVQNRGTIIPQQRATLVDAALKMHAEYLLFVDSDMRFPKDALVRLLAHEQPIVGVNYPRRRHPVLPTAERVTSGQREFLFTDQESDGLVKVTQCGLGFMLIHMAVFQVLAEPWFQIGFTKDDGQYVGEDFFFCKRARDAGFSILIDQSLSREIRHTGDLEYTHAHTQQAREALTPKPLVVPSGT